MVSWKLLPLLYIPLLSVLGAEGHLDTEKAVRGFEKATNFADIVQTQGFTDILKGFTETISPWVEAHNIMAGFYRIFNPKEDTMMNAMNKGFTEVNSKLDDIKNLLEDVIQAIDWAVMKFQYSAIEQKILALSTLLQDAYKAPDPKAGREKFLLQYHTRYANSGNALYNSIVHDEWVFQQNILKAGMMYTDYTRAAMQELMKGLISLLMKASALEIAADNFMGWDTDIAELWGQKLEECKEAMRRTDHYLELKWMDLMPTEMDALAEANQGLSHSDFADLAYEFFTTKYYWMDWFVLSYDQLSTYKEHAILYTQIYTHYRFRWYGRNYVVSRSHSGDWDTSIAKWWLKDVECTRPSKYCYKEPAKVLNQRLPTGYAITRSIIKERSSWAWRAKPERVVYDTISLWGHGGRWPFFVIYFG